MRSPTDRFENPDCGNGSLTLVQRRSRERQDRIITVASEMIAEVGSDALTMKALAEQCGVSIGSLYQHFRDKGAILVAIAARYHEATRNCIEEALEPATDWPTFSSGFAALIAGYLGIFQTEPVIRDVWSGIAASKELRDLELRSARDNGAHLARHILRIQPDADPLRVESTAFFIMALGESVMRLAILCPVEEQDVHVERYTIMAIAELSRAAGSTLSDKQTGIDPC